MPITGIKKIYNTGSATPCQQLFKQTFYQQTYIIYHDWFIFRQETLRILSVYSRAAKIVSWVPAFKITRR